MAKFLVIAEKPSVAHSLAKNLSAYQREDGYLEGNSCIVNMMKNIQNGNLMICRLFQIYGRCRCLKTRKNSLRYYAD